MSYLCLTSLTGLKGCRQELCRARTYLGTELT